LDEKISLDSAIRDYGVAIGPDGEIDVRATECLRSARRAAE